MVAPTLGVAAPQVARAFRDRVLTLGVAPVNRLEEALDTKFAETRSLEAASDEEFVRGFSAFLEGVLSTRAHREALVRATPSATVRGILREARLGRLGPADLPATADRIAGGPAEVRLDVAAELVHAAAPDRLALLTRWVWNPMRRTGILAEFTTTTPETHAGAQALLAEMRLELDALGFPSPSFAAVDVVLALTYAGRLQEAVDRSFQGGGIERLLPGVYPLAGLVLGVRRRLDRADR